jgi:catechol 2,3-dioxygenase-like lactoylglutathione lyase family enzyme
MTMIQETFSWVFVDANALDPTCAFYRDLLGGEETMRFAYPQMGLELAAISSPKLSVLVIAGPPEKRRPFEATRLTIKVDTLEPVLAALEKAGATIQPTPVGRKTRFRHADGLIVEYVDHSSRA